MSPNKCHQSDLGKLSPFLQKNAKTPPLHPSRCGRRYAERYLAAFIGQPR